jgi:hypothetical protein
MKAGSRPALRQRIAASMVAAAIAGALLVAAAPAGAADLSLGHGWRSRHVVRTDWRDRCAYAGYYCLYAEHGFVYAYPFDDRPIAHRRVRHAARD